MTRLYQLFPTWSKPSTFRAKGWTDSIQSYINEARDLACCIIANQKLMGKPYAWFVTVNIEPELSADEHRALWTKVCKSLRKGGVVALWVREPTTANRVHYHMLVKNTVPQKRLTELLRSAIGVPWHHSVEPVSTPANYAFYMTKGKIGGYTRIAGKPESVESVWLEDKFARKRLLFRANTKLKKHGKIGAFWEAPRQTIMDGIIKVNMRIAAGLRKDGILDLVDYVVDYIGITRSMARRHLGYWADSPNFVRWIEQLRLSGDIPPSPHPVEEQSVNNSQ